MKSLTRVWCGVALASAGLALAEPKKDSSFRPIQSDAADLITPVKPVPPPPPPQQGNNQQGQFPPGQGPNNKIPPPADTPAEIQNQPDIPAPVPEAAVDAASQADAARAAAEAQKLMDAIRAGQEGLHLGILDAEEARKRNMGFDPSRGGTPLGDAETAALIEQLRRLTGGSNRDGWSDTTKGYASAIETDPQSLLNSAGSGRTTMGGTEPGNSTDGWDTKTVNPDGTVTRTRTDGTGANRHTTRETTTRNPDGTTTTHSTFSSGRRSDVYGFQTIVVSADGRSQTGIESTRQSDGTWENRLFRSGRSSPDADWRAAGSSHRWRSDSPQTNPHDWTRNVDPDSAYGHGGGWLPGKAPKSILEKAGDVHTAGGRPPSADDHGGVGGGPRLNVDVDLAGQPNPDQAAGGSAVGSMIKNPNDDTVDPPRPIR